MAGERYLRPGWFTQHVFNGSVALLARLGISVAGSRELRVRGRTSGEWRTVPVNLLTVDGTRYLSRREEPRSGCAISGRPEPASSASAGGRRPSARTSSPTR